MLAVYRRKVLAQERQEELQKALDLQKTAAGRQAVAELQAKEQEAEGRRVKTLQALLRPDLFVERTPEEQRAEALRKLKAGLKDFSIKP